MNIFQNAKDKEVTRKTNSRMKIDQIKYPPGGSPPMKENYLRIPKEQVAVFLFKKLLARVLCM